MQQSSGSYVGYEDPTVGRYMDLPQTMFPPVASVGYPGSSFQKGNQHLDFDLHSSHLGGSYHPYAPQPPSMQQQHAPLMLNNGLNNNNNGMSNEKITVDSRSSKEKTKRPKKEAKPLSSVVNDSTSKKEEKKKTKKEKSAATAVKESATLPIMEGSASDAPPKSEFICEVCRKEFVTKGSLKTHGRVHTGERPFVCPCCSKGFTQQANCARHIRLMHTDKPGVMPVKVNYGESRDAVSDIKIEVPGFNQQTASRTYLDPPSQFSSESSKSGKPKKSKSVSDFVKLPEGLRVEGLNAMEQTKKKSSKEKKSSSTDKKRRAPFELLPPPPPPPPMMGPPMTLPLGLSQDVSHSSTTQKKMEGSSKKMKSSNHANDIFPVDPKKFEFLNQPGLLPPPSNHSMSTSSSSSSKSKKKSKKHHHHHHHHHTSSSSSRDGMSGMYNPQPGMHMDWLMNAGSPNTLGQVNPNLQDWMRSKSPIPTSMGHVPTMNSAQNTEWMMRSKSPLSGGLGPYPYISSDMGLFADQQQMFSPSVLIDAYGSQHLNGAGPGGLNLNPAVRYSKMPMDPSGGEGMYGGGSPGGIGSFIPSSASRQYFSLPGGGDHMGEHFVNGMEFPTNLDLVFDHPASSNPDH